VLFELGKWLIGLWKRRGKYADVVPGAAPIAGDVRRVSFMYEDASGVITEREVSISSADGEYFTGYCSLRRKPRTFRYDRVVDGEVVLVDTGEMVSVWRWMNRL